MHWTGIKLGEWPREKISALRIITVCVSPEWLAGRVLEWLNVIIWMIGGAECNTGKPPTVSHSNRVWRLSAILRLHSSRMGWTCRLGNDTMSFVLQPPSLRRCKVRTDQHVNSAIVVWHSPVLYCRSLICSDIMCFNNEVSRSATNKALTSWLAVLYLEWITPGPFLAIDECEMAALHNNEYSPQRLHTPRI